VVHSVNGGDGAIGRNKVGCGAPAKSADRLLHGRACSAGWGTRRGARGTWLGGRGTRRGAEGTRRGLRGSRGARCEVPRGARGGAHGARGGACERHGARVAKCRAGHTAGRTELSVGGAGQTVRCAWRAWRAGHPGVRMGRCAVRAGHTAGQVLTLGGGSECGTDQIGSPRWTAAARLRR